MLIHPLWMFDQMRTRGPRLRLPMSFTTSSGTSSVRAGTAYRRSGPRLRQFHAKSRSSVSSTTPRASTRRLPICRSRYPSLPIAILVKIMRTMRGSTWTSFVLTASPSDAFSIATTCFQVGMIPLRHFPTLNLVCPAFGPTVKWDGARFHPDPDTAEAYAGSGYVSENDFSFSPIANRFPHVDQTGFAG